MTERQLYYVKFHDGRERGFLTARAALRYADSRSLAIVSVSRQRRAK